MVAVKMGLDGRVLIPRELRQALGVAPGEMLVVRVERRQLVLERPHDVLRRLQDRFAHVPSDVSLADELLDQRRRERDSESSRPSAS